MYKKETPTNLAVLNCDFDNYKSGDVFRFDVEPKQSHGKDEILLLNPSIYLNNYEKDFRRIGNTETYVSTDPRLISASHEGQILRLDRPAFLGEVKLKDIYTEPTLQNYGKTYYKDYNDVIEGQIMYYIDKSISDPFFKPVFANQSLAVGRNYADPMSSFKPSYERIPVIAKNKQNYEGGLSFLEDTGGYREDLMSYQMSVINRQKYEARWT